ncbi:cytochrome o ubiquinol oxidase subunit III [Candidatus Kaiserbacteria bacterium]|nr:cytochrome o ubiquinol oxidase subunit III [Candidatus Kaiserbacteria bacterium]
MPNDKVTFGFWVYLMSDCVLFAGLFATYAVLQGATFGAPSVQDFVSLPFVLVETLLLLTSSFMAGLALLAARHHKKVLALGALALTLLLGLTFLGMELHEFGRLIAEGSGPSTSASLSAFFVLVGTHGLHVALGSLWMLVIMLHVALRGLSEGTLRKLACFGLFWHFLDIIWIFIFTFVYLFGALAL